MPYVAARVLAAAASIVVAAVLLSAGSVFAKDPDNPNGSHDGLFNNPGHHYGQLKHQTPSPVPSPTPTPTPAPSQGSGTTSLGATHQPGGSGNARSRLQARSWIPSLPVTLVARSAGQLRLAEPLLAGDGLWWLLLLILPLLLAVWALVATRMAVTGLRRVRAGKPAAQMSPATS